MKIKFTSSLLPLSILYKAYARSSVSHCEFVFSDGMSIYPALEVGRVILNKTQEAITRGRERLAGSTDKDVLSQLSDK